jgi:ABC-type branched-subunit amino acid transport system permease subunit
MLQQLGYVKYGMGIFINPHKRCPCQPFYAAACICTVSVYWSIFASAQSWSCPDGIRDDDVASEMMGVDISMQLTCFLISAFVTGISLASYI